MDNRMENAVRDNNPEVVMALHRMGVVVTSEHIEIAIDDFNTPMISLLTNLFINPVADSKFKMPVLHQERPQQPHLHLHIV